MLVKTSKSKSNILLVKKTELCKDSNARAHRGAHTELKEFLQGTAFFLKDAFIKLTYIHSDTYRYLGPRHLKNCVLFYMGPMAMRYFILGFWNIFCM